MVSMAHEKTKPTSEITSILAGVAGEYFVAAELSRLGYIASITLRNTRGIDILASNADASKQVGIQVKTNKSNKPEWILNEKAEEYFADNLFYVFVCLKSENDAHPDFYVVPSSIVAEYTKRTHHEWLVTPGKKGQQHNKTPVRKFQDSDGKYKNKWELLGL
jgi:hypothetical protein